MAHAHNVIIRGLNAIIQQGPYVPCASNKMYRASDVKDFLFYVNSWVKMVNHHHWVEETFIFPEMEKFSGRPGLMDDPRHQHELFHPGMERLLAYSSATAPEEYLWEGGMKDVIDSFSKELTDHLYAEIDVLLKLGDLDSVGLQNTWDRAENIAKQTGNIGMLGHVPTLEEYWAFRLGISAVYVSCAAGEFSMSTHLPAVVVSSKHMDVIWRETNVIISVTNDLVSLKKEMRLDCIDSIVPLTSALINHIQEAISKSPVALKCLKDRFDQAENSLLSQHLGDEKTRQKVEEFIEVQRSNCVGNLIWR
ncbi:hypothetical protein SLS62_010645 [Diatrype stigma]|uniref:Hemerythrin-like domain-containing protein n=1 Tax=Diatrype stigma TaxID=117547 RepID=A0AAN9UAS1_9PEZI